MNNYDQYDQESQALLHSIKPLSFDELIKNGQNKIGLPKPEKRFEDISQRFADKSPFKANSIFTIQNGEFFSGETDILNILRHIGAIIPEYDEDIENKGIELKEVIIQAEPVSPRVFNYLEYSNESSNFINYWTHKNIDYSGQAVLNKKVAYVDAEKILLAINGLGIARYSLYIPYSNDSNVSINNSNIPYLEKNAAIIIKDLEIDGLTTILSFLENSRRGEYLDRVYKNTAEEIERNYLNSPALLTILDNLTLSFLKHFKSKSLDIIFFGLLRMNLGQKNEVILLKTLQAIYSKTAFNPDTFLNKLITEKINNKTSFQILYDNMNDWGGENNFSKLIIELTKIWLLSSYSDRENKIYNKYEPIEDLVYNQKIILGFRNSDLIFEFNGNNEIVIANNTFFENPIKQHYHIFQPIRPTNLSEKQNEDLSLAEGITIPAFYLKAFDDKGVWENFEKAAWLILDVVSTFTGIGNLVKLRYLINVGKASKLIYIRLAFNIIQVTAGTLSIGLSLIENSKNKDLVYKIRMYLFWVEICTLGADLLSTRILTKQASEAKDALAKYRETIINKKKLKNLEELQDMQEFEKHLDEIIEAGAANKKVFSIWKINIKEGKLNCANCAIAVDATLAGHPASALPWTYQKVMKNGKLIDIISYDKGTNISVLEIFFKRKFSQNVTIDIIKETLAPGQRGIIFAYKKNSTLGHFFNVLNEDGVVKFLDGQTGKSANLIYDVYKLLPTNF